MNPLSVDWASLFATALNIGMVVGQMKLAERHPLAPWQQVGSEARVNVVNPSRDSVLVYVSAPEVDDASRRLGVVPPCDSSTFRLPYADTKVRVNVSGRVTVIDVDRPDTSRVQAVEYPTC